MAKLRIVTDSTADIPESVRKQLGIEMVRFSFVDQHGVLRGKTISRGALAAAMRSGVTAPSSLLLKDTSGQTVFPVFSSDPEVGTAGFVGAGDIVLVPDPTTFRVLPWTERTGWLLCDLYFRDGSPVPFCTRRILRNELTGLAAKGFGMTVGAELEFHVFRSQDAELTVEHVGAPGRPGAAKPTVAPGGEQHQPEASENEADPQGTAPAHA